MKRSLIFLFTLASLSGSVAAQTKDPMVEQLMTKRTINCPDIYYNAISLIPQLYREGKTDTINAIIDYTHRKCEIYTATVAYVLLRSIETHTFREAINNPGNGATTDSQQQTSYYQEHIIAFLNTYTVNARRNIETPYSDEPNDLRVANHDYTEFIKAMAASIAARPGLSPVEQFLADLYAHPESAKFDKLKSSVYKSSLLQRAYRKTAGDDGVEYAVSAGIWKPSGKLAVLGDHPSFSCYIGARQNGFTGGMTFSTALDRSPVVYQVKKDDHVYKTDHFAQYYIGYDFAQALYSTRRTELALGAGLGYDGINALTKNSDNPSRTLSSFNWNLGAGFKVFLAHREHGSISHTYIGVQAKYNFVSYNNPGGTDLTGHSAVFMLTFGGFTVDRPIHYETTTTRRFRCWG